MFVVASCLLLASAHALPAVVVTGATGRVGAAVVRELIGAQRLLPNDIYLLVRDPEKASELHRGVHFLTAAYDDEAALAAALASVPQDFRLFLACSNGPSQALLESNVCRAAHEHGCEYIVKLSTATPVLERRQGGPHAAHLEVERLLTDLGVNHAVLRPNLFLDEVSFGGFLGVCGPLATADACTHPFASSRIAAVDVRDVGACGAALLAVVQLPQRGTGGSYYEVNGAAPAATLGEELANAISELRPRPVSIDGCTIDDYLAPRGMPPAAVSSLAGFLRVLSEECAATSDVVHELTGGPPRSVREFVRDHAPRFLPKTFQCLLGTPAPSFRAGARVAMRPTSEQVDALADDELLVRTLVAGINGGADTFTLTRAAADATDIPLGKEGVGVAVAVGAAAAQAGFAPGQRVAFIGAGFAEYARVSARLCYAVSAEGDAAEQTAMRVSGHTAAVALGYTAPVQAGDVVVVTACCGATGSFAVQLAKAAGATVIGTVGSEAKAAEARRLGVDRVVQHRAEELAAVLRDEFADGVDLAYEGVGGPLLGAICAHLKPSGNVLVVGSISQYPHNAEKPAHSVEGLGDIMNEVFRRKTVRLPSGGQLVGNVWGDSFSAGVLPAFRDRIYADHAAGKIVALVDEASSFAGVAEAPDAVEHMLSGRSMGKVVLRISEH